MLTTKQKELLMFIHERLKETGVPPSFDEMKEALDLKSKSGIHRLITALEERGFVRRLPHRARAMEIVRLPDSMPQALAARARGFSPSVIEGSLGRVPQVAEGESLPQTVSVPVMGRIAAGVPIEAIQNRMSTVEVPTESCSAISRSGGWMNPRRTMIRPASTDTAGEAGSPGTTPSSAGGPS